MGNTPGNKGKRISEETRKKLSRASLGTRRSAETKEKMSISIRKALAERKVKLRLENMVGESKELNND